MEQYCKLKALGNNFSNRRLQSSNLKLFEAIGIEGPDQVTANKMIWL